MFLKLSVHYKIANVHQHTYTRVCMLAHARIKLVFGQRASNFDNAFF